MHALRIVAASTALIAGAALGPAPAAAQGPPAQTPAAEAPVARASPAQMAPVEAPVAQVSPAQVISRAELRAAGWTRLSEVVFAARGVARASVDGITVLGNASGLPTWSLAPGDDEWLVLVDDVPVPLALGGTRLLDLLPVSLSQLDSVTITRGPAFVAGRHAPRGAIRFHTQRAVHGTHGEASQYAGNEVGDAGPFTFTPRATPNVDNSGPFQQARLAHGDGRWVVDAAVRRWIDNLTDPRLIARYDSAAGGGIPDLWVRHLASTLHAGFTGTGGRHDVVAGTAQLRGTFFVPGTATDQSLETRLTYVGADGLVAAPAATLAYRVQGAQLRSAPYDAPLPATPAHTRRELSASLDATRPVGGTRLTVGVEAERHALDDGAAVPVASRSLAGASGFVRASRAGRAPWQVSVSAGSGEGGARVGALVNVGGAVAPSTGIDASVAIESRPYGDRGAWVDLALLGLDGISGDRRVSAVGDVALRRGLTAGATLVAGASARRETGLRLLNPDAAPAPEAPPAISRPLALTSAELRTGIELPLGPRLHGGALYRIAAPLAGDAELRDAAQALPRHLLDADVTMMPVADVRLRAALHLASRTRWRIAGEADTVPAVNRLDVSVEKWLVHHRLRAQLLARNLLNDVERYHPLGADFRLRVYAGLTASF